MSKHIDKKNLNYLYEIYEILNGNQKKVVLKSI